MPGAQITDPDGRLLRWGWRACAAWAVVGGLQLALALRAGEAGLIYVTLTAPLWAVWLLWLLWRSVVALRSTLARRALGRWQGVHCEFDGRRIRILFDDDQIFVAAADVFDALAIEPRGRFPDRVRLIAGRNGLVELPGQRQRVFTERGLRAWMERRTDPAAARFGRWFEAEVVAPQRKRCAVKAGQIRAGAECPPK